MKEKDILVSVILPVYNVEKYLNKCMETVVQQTYKNIDIKLVDDGSKDSSGSLCDEWAKKDSRISVIHKKNAGLGMARNTGLEYAKGEYVVFVDSDDFLEEEAIEKCISQKGNADTVLCGHYIYYNDNKIENKPIKYKDKFFEKKEEIEKILIEMMGSLPEALDDISLPVSVWHGLYSMEIIRSNGIKFPSEREFISEDMVFDIDYFSKAKKIKFISDCLYYYRKNNETSLTSVYNAERFKKEIILYKELDRKLSLLFQEKIYKSRLQRTFLGRTRSCIIRAVKQSKKPLEEIKEICKNEVVMTVLKEYPYQKNKKELRFFNFCIKKKYIKLLYFMVKLKYRN